MAIFTICWKWHLVWEVMGAAPRIKMLTKNLSRGKIKFIVGAQLFLLLPCIMTLYGFD